MLKTLLMRPPALRPGISAAAQFELKKSAKRRAASVALPAHYGVYGIGRFCRRCSAAKGKAN
jgi:hypothetical protein